MQFKESLRPYGNRGSLNVPSAKFSVDPRERLQMQYENPPLEGVFNSLGEYYSEPQNILNTALDFVPGFGDVKNALEAIIGKTATNEPLNWWERGLSGLGALPLVPSLISLKKGAKSGKMDLMTLKKGAGDIPTTETPKVPEGGGIDKLSHKEFKKYLYDQAVETRMEPTAPGSPDQEIYYLRAKIGDEGTFFRKGKLPDKGQSYNYAEGRYEKGVSVYPSPQATSMAGLSEGDWYYGRGKIVDIGSDGEPVINPIGDWKNIGKNEYEAVEKYHKILIKSKSLPNPSPPAKEAGVNINAPPGFRPWRPNE
jgi:hypothetical protein